MRASEPYYSQLIGQIPTQINHNYCTIIFSVVKLYSQLHYIRIMVKWGRNLLVIRNETRKLEFHGSRFRIFQSLSSYQSQFEITGIWSAHIVGPSEAHCAITVTSYLCDSKVFTKSHGSTLQLPLTATRSISKLIQLYWNRPPRWLPLNLDFAPSNLPKSDYWLHVERQAHTSGAAAQCCCHQHTCSVLQIFEREYAE